MKPHATGCECVDCLIPEDDAERCTKHKQCAGREGHGGGRVGLRRALRIAARWLLTGKS